MSSYQYRKSHCGDKTVVRLSYLHNVISYTGKMTSLYWFSPLGPRPIQWLRWWDHSNLNIWNDNEMCENELWVKYIKFFIFTISETDNLISMDISWCNLCCIIYLYIYPPSRYIFIIFSCLLLHLAMSLIDNRSRHWDSSWVLSQYEYCLSRSGELHYKDKMVARSFFIYNGDPYIGKTTSLYWDGPQKDSGSHQVDYHIYIPWSEHVCKCN